MADISKTEAIFFVTSPRSPFKMIDELKLLVANFDGQPWNKSTQTKFAKLLSKSKFFEGNINKNFDFAARDRINRAPKSLGFIDLSPVIKLTEAGKNFIEGRRPNEALLKQILKFQLPSPYHKDTSGRFKVKPYLELLRLINDLDGLTKDEIAIFAMQLINCQEYNLIKNKILKFRKHVRNIDRSKTSYKRELRKVAFSEIKKTFNLSIAEGRIQTRESEMNDLTKFLSTKLSNHKDYADAAIRYLRATELVSIKPHSYKVYIPDDRKEETQFLLDNVDSKPYEFANAQKFKEYLFSATNIQLLTDNKQDLISIISKYDVIKQLQSKSIEELKDIRDNLVDKKIQKELTEQIKNLQTYEHFSDIYQTFEEIENNCALDPSLVFEWNTWRAFEMLDDGKIQGNLRFDEQGMPLSHAPGNMPDIECFYTDFDLIIEVTLSTGQKQYEMEGEPVARHLGNHRKATGKNSYCIFLAKSLNAATLAHFFYLHKVPIGYYGGKSSIIPMELSLFKEFIARAKESSKKPNSKNLCDFLNNTAELAQRAISETEWYEFIKQAVLRWI